MSNPTMKMLACLIDFIANETVEKPGFRKRLPLIMGNFVLLTLH
jgi:hypothetical protein